MPTYEYACSECGHRFDIRQSFHDEPLRDCPECGAGVYRVIHPAGVVFKGSGWYINDSRSGSQASHSDATKSSKDKESSEKSGDAAPATASPASSAASNGSSGGDSSASDSKGASGSKPKSETKTPVKAAADD